MKKVSTMLPVFTGFYNTLFNVDNLIYFEVENINVARLENNLNEIDSTKLFELIEFDNTKYETDCAIECCKVIETELQKRNLISSIKFNSVILPKGYSYSNDSIDCTIELTIDNINNIKKYLELNSTLFSQYLHSKYSSRDGFISFYPNNVKGWIELTNNFTDYSDYNTLYSVLDFICKNESIDVMYLYNEIDILSNVNLNVLNYEKMLRLID